MTRAESSTSGMKHSPSRMRAPTTSMPGRSASSRISRGAAPVASERLGHGQGDALVAVDDGLLELVFHLAPPRLTPAT